MGVLFLFLLFTFALNVPLEVSRQNTVPYFVLESSSLWTPHHLFNVGWKRFLRCCIMLTPLDMGQNPEMQ
jgi:hypothetical protein